MSVITEMFYAQWCNMSIPLVNTVVISKPNDYMHVRQWYLRSLEAVSKSYIYIPTINTKDISHASYLYGHRGYTRGHSGPLYTSDGDFPRSGSSRGEVFFSPLEVYSWIFSRGWGNPLEQRTSLWRISRDKQGFTKIQAVFWMQVLGAFIFRWKAVVRLLSETRFA